MQICEMNNCTACGLCAFSCPQKCIALNEDKAGILRPDVDESICIKCNRCVKICPQNNEITNNVPNKAFAAWSNDAAERKTSASGGIAAEIYKYTLNSACSVVGAELSDDFSVSLKITDKIKETEEFKNSKYVFCNSSKIYEQIKDTLKKNKNVVVVGLPCQIAAIKIAFPSEERLVLVDLICHGTTPAIYLKQYVKYLEELNDEKIAKIYFRDPDLDTSKFYFSAYSENGKRMYAKRTLDGELYNFGYHRAISYRENCYNCKYAQPSRVGDITLGDYNGKDFSLKEKVSLVLANTPKGEQLIKNMVKNGYISAFEQNVSDVISNNRMLQKPIDKNKYAEIFRKRINKNQGEFVKAIKPIYRVYRRDMVLNKYISFAKRAIKKIYKA